MKIQNEKIILDVKGEYLARKMGQLEELKNIDNVYSSNYVRVISTAKYIAYENNVNIIVDENFNERKLGDLQCLKKLGEGKNNSYTAEQLIDENLKNIDVESRKEVTKRFFESFDKILNDDKEKIVIVAHGAIIKFALLK